MPIRSLNSSVLKWPDRDAVHSAVAALAGRLRATYPAISAVGYFGSYVRGDWGVGSDVDLIIRVSEEDWDTMIDATSLPVPADVLVYTDSQWTAVQGRMRKVLYEEVVWV